jgi:hypothetical protein
MRVEQVPGVERVENGTIIPNRRTPKKSTEYKRNTMKLKFFPLLFGLLCAGNIFGQIPLDCSNSCSYFGESIDETTYGFTSDKAANEALENIVKHTGLPINFTLMAGNVPNAAAVIRCDQATNDCQRYIVYNQDFMLRVKQRTKTDWAAVSILAHEIGHHLSGHTLLSGGSRPQLELEADKFSGFVLYNMGATLEEAQIAINTFVGETQSATHPGRSARVAAITNGWIQASEINPGVEREADEKAEIASNNLEAARSGILWRHDGANKKYGLYVNGQSIASRCEKSYCGDHYIVYDPAERKTYLLEDFKDLKDNQLRAGKLLGAGPSIFWRHDGVNNKYGLYVNGQSITSRCEKSYCGDHYIVYDPQEQKTYLLEDFRNLKDNQVRAGKLLGTGPSVFWRHDGVNNKYGLYVNGQAVASRSEETYCNDDYIVYDPQERKTYLLENFRNLKDGRVRAGKLLGTGPSIFWRHDGLNNKFALYVNGESIASRCEKSFSEDDYILYDPVDKKRYVLENFRNLNDNQLRPGRAEQ